jgi:hypothetical protein
LPFRPPRHFVVDNGCGIYLRNNVDVPAKPYLETPIIPEKTASFAGNFMVLSVGHRKMILSHKGSN